MYKIFLYKLTVKKKCCDTIQNKTITVIIIVSIYDNYV